MRRLVTLLLILILPVPCWAAASRSFDGTNDNINFGGILNVGTGDVSACLWVKTTEDATTDALIGRKNDFGSGSAGYMLLQGAGDTLSFQAADGTTVATSGSSTTDPDGIWEWVCGTWDGAGNNATIFVNQTQENTGTASVGSLSNSVSFIMGETAAGTQDAAGLFAYGMIYNGILSGVEQAEARWNPDLGALTTSRTGYWPLWGDSPELDFTGNGRTGTVNNATTSSDGPPVFFGMGLPL